MFKRKTSRVRRGRDARHLHLKVNSPRIFGFSCLRFMGRCVKMVVLASVLVGVGWGAKVGLRKVFIENEEFTLKVIDLDPSSQIREGDFVRVTGIDPAGSVFAVSLSDVREKLEAYPCIVDVDISRRLPDTLRVEVTEREPVAWLDCRPLGIVAGDAERGLLIDEHGVLFPCEPWWEEATRDLPVVVVTEAGPGDFESGEKLDHREAERALHLVRLSRRMLESEDWGLAAVGVRNDFALTAVTTKGTLVTFGMYEHKRQLGDLLALERHARQAARPMERINLLPERNIPVIFSPGAMRPDGKVTPAPENRLEKAIQTLLNRR